MGTRYDDMKTQALQTSNPMCRAQPIILLPPPDADEEQEGGVEESKKQTDEKKTKNKKKTHLVKSYWMSMKSPGDKRIFDSAELVVITLPKEQLQMNKIIVQYMVYENMETI